VSRLKVKWAFAYPDTAYGQPVIAAGRVYVTSRTGWIFSLDAETGCTYWAFDASAPVRTAIVVGALPATGKFAAYFGDEKGNAGALDVETGKLLWKTTLDDHPLARITGAPKLFRGRLYVPVSSMEEASGRTPTYPCCTFRGSLAALDAATGALIWQTYTIPDKATPTRRNLQGVQMYGPAGAAIWGSPAIDPERGLIYVGTGDSYTDTPIDTTDAILAFDLETGKRVWTTQVRKNDAWLVGCAPGHTPDNCPQAPGPDFDFGAPPILHRLADSRQIILAAAKSGIIYGFDPDAQGKRLWQNKVGEGSSGGGVMWGAATDETRIFVAMDDTEAQPPFAPGGVTALGAATGKVAWHAPAPAPVCAWGQMGCTAAQRPAAATIPGLIFAGSSDGHMRGYSTASGKIVWDFDTGRSFAAVNGVQASGGSIDMGGEAIGGGLLLVNSGASAGHPGNLLLAFTVDGR
jgi:polyvinyl alcohol dehydrogenase (cytochrome)